MWWRSRRGARRHRARRAIWRLCGARWRPKTRWGGARRRPPVGNGAKGLVGGGCGRAGGAAVLSLGSPHPCLSRGWNAREGHDSDRSGGKGRRRKARRGRVKTSRRPAWARGRGVHRNVSARACAGRRQGTCGRSRRTVLRIWFIECCSGGLSRPGSGMARGAHMTSWPSARALPPAMKRSRLVLAGVEAWAVRRGLIAAASRAPQGAHRAATTSTRQRWEGRPRWRMAAILL